MLNPIYLDYLLALAFNENDVEKLNSIEQTEKDVKTIENKFLQAWNIFDGYSEDDVSILLPYAEKQDITVTPNEYSNIFAFNRCLRHLFENDIAVFKDIGIYATLLTWSVEQEYFAGNRILYPLYTVFKSSDRYKIYVCAKPHVIGKDAIPDASNTMSYYESLYYEKLPDNIVWVEDLPFLDSFLISTNGMSLLQFNTKFITDLAAFTYFSTLNNTITNPNKFSESSILVNSQFRKLYDNNKNMSWPANRPVAYTDFSVSSCMSSPKTPASLYYLEPAEEIQIYTAKDGLNDYVVSSVVENFNNNDTNTAGTRWLRQWKSGWIEQGGTYGILFNSNKSDELDGLAIVNKFIGNDTYLIGIHPEANFLCKTEIEPILNFTDKVELFNINANVQKVIWGTVGTNNEFTVNDNIYSDIINNQFVLNQAEIYSNNVNTHYTKATYCFTGTCYDKESTADYNLCSAISAQTSAVISWEMQGILI